MEVDSKLVTRCCAKKERQRGSDEGGKAEKKARRAGEEEESGKRRGGGGDREGGVGIGDSGSSFERTRDKDQNSVLFLYKKFLDHK